MNEKEIRRDERERLLKRAREWAKRAKVPLIEVPALVVLLIDDRPMTEDDIKRGQEIAAEIASGL